MQLKHKAGLLLTSLTCANSNLPPKGDCRAANSAIENPVTRLVAASIETRFITTTVTTTTTTNNTVVSTVIQLPCEPTFNSNPPFVNPHWIWLKHCNGPAAPNNGGCTGDCEVYAQECNSDDESWLPREKLHSCRFKARNTQCIETNGKVIFRTCSLDIWGQRADPWHTCTAVCDFNPGVTEHGTWIYNTRWTKYVDVYPNPDAVWAKDFNSGSC